MKTNQKKIDIVDFIHSIYNDIPTEEVTFETFKKTAIDRLSLLKKIELLAENAQLDESNQSRKQLDDKIINALMKYDLTFNQHELTHEKQNIHNIGHYLLKLSYSQSEDTKNWLIKYETMLFHAILNKNLLQQSQQSLLNKLGISYENVSNQEWIELKQ